MQPFRATLTDDAGETIAAIEGSIDSPGESQGPRQGEFVFQETDSFMQGVLEQKAFRLELDDGDRLTIRVGSVSASAGPSSSKVEFSVL
jgi:hypothetical protein